MNKKLSPILVILFSAGVVCAQTNTFPGTGKAGIGTTSPGADLHIKTDGTNSPWLALDKNAGQETGVQFRKSGSVMFYLYSDNVEDDALKIQSTALTGENDSYPRIFIPRLNKDLYLATSGGNVAVGHKTPSYKLDVYSPGDTWKARFHSDDGYILMGPANASWAHIYTDRPNFIFNTNLWSITGGFSSYNSSDLSLQTNGTPRVTVANSSGYIGISTTSPSARLNVQQASGAWNDGIRLSLLGKHWDIVADTDGDRLIIAKDQNIANGIVLKDGNVGIGSSSPTQKLTVDGTIYGKEVKVDLSVPGPDYVFEKDYKLLSLRETEEYINEFKHLPEVPFAKEMEMEGINLSEMNMILLKKIEQLTLYLIEQNKRLEKQERCNEELTTEIQLLKNGK